MSLVVWGVVVVVGVVTFVFRHSFVYLFGRVETIPPRLRAPLRYVPPAVLAALVAPALVGSPLAAGPVLTPRTAAGGVAALVAWRTENTGATLVAGMVALWTLTGV
ncbi:MAG: AzlD domain-containing protein [Haloferacaceae archaeon]